MPERISRQIDALDEIRSNIQTVVQSVSSGGWDLSQGRMSGGRAAADLLDAWYVRFRGTLPDDIMLILGGLMTAVRNWRSNMGRTATPVDLIKGQGNTVNGLLRAVGALQANLNAQLESPAECARGPNMTINISGGQIGNLNLGEIIGDLQATLRAVTDQGGDTVAECLKQLSEAIVRSKGLEDSAKAESLDQVKEVASQAATEPAKRKKGILKSILATLKSTLSGINDIAGVWVHAEEILNDLFGAS